MGFLQKETGDWDTQDMEKTEVLNDFFASDITSSAPATPPKSRKLQKAKSMAPDEMHPQILKEIVDEAAKPLFIMFEKSWQPSKVPTAWKRGNTTATFRKGQKEELGNCMLLSLTSVPGNGAVGYCCFHVNHSPLSSTPCHVTVNFLFPLLFPANFLFSTCDLYLFVPPVLFSILPQAEGETGSKQAAHGLKILSRGSKLGSTIPKLWQLGSTALCPNGEQ